MLRETQTLIGGKKWERDSEGKSMGRMPNLCIALQINSTIFQTVLFIALLWHYDDTSFEILDFKPTPVYSLSM